MSASRLRIGEALTGIGAVGLLVCMFLKWFTVDPPPAIDINRPGFSAKGLGINPKVLDSLAQTGWEALGWLALVLTVLAIAAGLAATLLPLLRQPVAWSVSASVAATAFGILGFIAVTISVISQPSIPLTFANGPQLPDSWIAIEAPAYAAIFFSGLILAGGWWIMADERREAPYSAAPDIEPRPAPPATAAPEPPSPAAAPEPPPAAS